MSEVKSRAGKDNRATPHLQTSVYCREDEEWSDKQHNEMEGK